MRRRALFPFATAAVALAVAVLPAACDATLNLGDADGSVVGDARDALASFAATCAGACDKVVACGLLTSEKRAACVSDCVTQAPQSLLDCIARTPCAALQSSCSAGFDASLPDTSAPPFDSGQEDFEIMNCQQACDSLHFFSCLDAGEQATCRDLCSTAPKSRRNTFFTCGEAAGGNCPNARDCYSVFVGD